MNIKTYRHIMIVSAVLFGLQLAGSPSVFAEKDFGKGFDKEGWEEEVNKMQDELGLSQQQRDALKSHKVRHRQGMSGLREELKQKQQELREEMQKSDFDAGRVRMINDEIKRLHNEMSDERIEGVVEVRKILTPEQFSRFQRLKESRRDEFRKKHGDHGGGFFRERIKERIKERQD
jgi:Spy/CpxP family protein refolding chaperone